MCKIYIDGPAMVSSGESFYSSSEYGNSDAVILFILILTNFMH